MIKGSCDCGKVAFSADNESDKVTICHCSQCRRTSGHQWAATQAAATTLEFSCDEGLQWYESSNWAKRGFCKFCGSSLFYRMNNESSVSIAAGCVDSPTGLKVTKHIFVADKGDYYDITDGLPQIDKY
ncbi:GFA family protein [Roseibium sp.]|uniref:GFA family protein n=1 Tax=Roseibium sp. TaxID=1936156 RepID=UPI003A98715E